jgi:hypothetical protein
MRTPVAIAGLFAGLLLTAASPAYAVVGFADIVLDFHDSGAGPIAGPYGGTFPGASPVSVSTSVVLGPDGPVADFLSLPLASFVTVGFTDEIVFDRLGDDIFIGEIGATADAEEALIFVSGDKVNFTFLGTATDGVVNAFDLASIGWVGQVSAVKIIGTDLVGRSPGFDLGFVGVSVAGVPEPASWATIILGFGVAGAAVRGRRRGFARDPDPLRVL